MTAWHPSLKDLVIGLCLVVALLFGSEMQAQESEAASANKFSLGLEFYGRAPFPMPSQGMRFGYRVGDALDIEAIYVRSEREILLTDYNYSEYGLMLKSFLNEFVHWGYGISVRTVELEYNAFANDEILARKIAERHQALVANVSFGVDFTAFDTVTLGSDLLSISLPVHWLKDEDGFPEDADDFEEDPKDFPYVESGFIANVHFLRTYVAVRF